MAVLQQNFYRGERYFLEVLAWRAWGRNLKDFRSNVALYQSLEYL